MNEPTPAAPAGALHYFTATLQDRSVRWLVDHVAALRQCFAQARSHQPFHIEAIVVLPEHLHAVWRLPLDDADFTGRWLRVQEAFTQALDAQGLLAQPSRWRRSKSGARSAWQGPVASRPLADAADLQRHVDYIHFNPVKHGWVMRAADWPYSSLHRFIRQGLAQADWCVAGAIEGDFGES